MNWLLSAILCGLLVEVARCLPFSNAMSRITRSGRRAVHLIRTASVSDHWKEKAMAAYAQSTFVGSVIIAGLLCVLAGIVAIAIFSFELISQDFGSFMFSWQGIAFSVLFASLYLFIRKRVARARL